MKKLRILLAIVACVSMFAACAGQNEGFDPVIIEEESVSVSATSGIDTDITDNVVIEDDSQPPREGMVRSRLTNEWIDSSVANMRPIAVMTPNESSAVPHYNLSQASIIYEANVEGRMTRMMAIYEDWTELDKIGNVRSLRTYFGYWSFEWDAFLVHFGGPYYINDLIAQDTTNNVNGSASVDGTAFFRSNDRKAPHNAYVSGEGILDVIDEKDYSLEYRDLTSENHFTFASKANPNTLSQYGEDAKSATYIDMSGCYPLTRCYFEYNEDDGLYYRSQHLSGGTDGPHIDAATGEQLTLKYSGPEYLLRRVK